MEKQKKETPIEKVTVRPVVCEKCKGRNFILFRRVNDNAQYILKCKDCKYCVEFRMFISWQAKVEKERMVGG